jgi:two-component system sensor histidine kinase/response regulator
MSDRVKFLLVDDVEENLVALSGLLASDSLDLYCAKSGIDALELVLRHDFALAIIDVHMPEMDGFELAELMRGSERSRHVPIIFATASGHEQQRVFKGYESGAVDFLFKPIDPHILKHKAGVFLELALQRQELKRQVEERERLLREVNETLRLNEMFTAALGHDLRTPLGAIMAGAQLVSAREGNESRVGQRIMSSAQRMAEMIEQLLDLSRARLVGGISIVPQPVDARTLVDKIVAEARASFATRSVLVEATGDTLGEWDDGRLMQVLANLVSNALRHGRAGGSVRVDISGDEARTVRISVHNEGTIAPQDLPHLFDPFHGAGKRTRGSEGLGLGLYIVQQIVKAHQGEVSVTSHEPHGTTFTVVLPRRR